MLIQVNEFLERQNLLGTTWKGVVIDNADPLELKRIKVTIAGLMTGTTDSLPWVTCNAPVGTSNTSGLHIVPRIGEQVEIEFPMGDIYFPQYSNTSYNSSTKNPDFTGEDYLGSIGFSHGNLKIKYKVDGSQFQIQLATSKITIKPDDILIEQGASKFHLTGGKVALGGAEELLDLVSQVCQKISEAQGNLGFPLSNSAKFIALKAKVDSIKGTL